MRSQIPPRPSGSDAEMTFMQAVWDRLWGRGSRLNSSGTVKVTQAGDGVYFHAAPPAGGGGSASGGVVLGRVTAEYSEYITVQPIQATGDGTYADTTGATFNVAKPSALRGFTLLQIDPAYTTDKTQTLSRVFSVVAPTGGTGVFVSGSDVGYLDMNIDCRIPTLSRRAVFSDGYDYRTST